MSDQSEQKGNIFIGEGVAVIGSFTVPGRAVVNGTFDGELLADELLVGKQGRLTGQIRVRCAEIQGETHDTLAASSRLIIRSTGRVNGRATYAELEIERGGLVTGTIEPTQPPTAPLVMQSAAPSGAFDVSPVEVSSEKAISERGHA